MDSTVQLHPELAAVLQGFENAPSMDLTSVPIAQVRAAMAQFQMPGPQGQLHEVRELQIPGPAGSMGARLYRATAAAAAPVMVFFHGGGWCIGSVQSHDGLCRHLALLSGCNVVSVEYRLAPEHPFPAPLDDCYTATRWVADNAASLGSDARMLAVAGDSAGGNLALAVALRAKEEGWTGIRQQLLLYPVIDVRMDSASFDTCSTSMLNREGMGWMWSAYHPGRPVHPLACLADYPDVSGLPPAVMLLAEVDVLRDEGAAMAHRLLQSGVPVVVHKAAGMFHGFANFSAMSPAVEQVLRQGVESLQWPVAEVAL